MSYDSKTLSPPFRKGGLKFYPLDGSEGQGYDPIVDHYFYDSKPCGSGTCPLIRLEIYLPLILFNSFPHGLESIWETIVIIYANMFFCLILIDKKQVRMHLTCSFDRGVIRLPTNLPTVISSALIL